MSTEPDWSLPATWHADFVASKKIAEGLRAEADMFYLAWTEACAEGRHEDAAALRLSMWGAKTRAARIERELRGIDGGQS